MPDYGTPIEPLAQIALSFRVSALKNPNASLPDPITIDDVLASPMVAEPLHKLDCCLVTDGAGALVVTSAERARDLPRPPVYVLRSEEHTSELQSLMRISYAVFCLKKNTTQTHTINAYLHLTTRHKHYL